MIDAYASHRHLAEHLRPIWEALPERGTFWVGARTIRRELAASGLDCTLGRPDTPGPLTLVANHHDYVQVHPARPVAYLEHGAGQTYEGIGAHPAYSGGKDRDRVALFLTLNETTAERERRAYPEARVEIIGSPRLDALDRLPRAELGKARPVVALCPHWHCGLLPETESAWIYFRREVAALARTGEYKLLGHGHPRAFPGLARDYERMGIEAVPPFAAVVQRAHLVVTDNSSSGYEAAALGLPTVWCNSPNYRRDVAHGLRFWNQIPGPQAEPGGLQEAISASLCAPDGSPWGRAGIVASIYPPATRGRAEELAVAALEKSEKVVATI